MAQKVGAWTDLRRWIYKEGFAIKKGDGTGKGKETHLLLNGGRFILPDDRNVEFLNRYARALFEGEWQYVVEKKTTPLYYMMCEFDIKLEGREITREEIEAIITIVQSKVMSVAFPDRDVRVVVCTAPSKPSTLDDNTPVVQSGIHTLWRVLVDGTTSWQLRAWMLRTLESELAGFKEDGVTPKFPLLTRWSEAFDSCIFEANGLRMVGARKAIKCPECDGQSYKNDGEWGKVCAGCQNVGRIDLGRPYNLLYVAKADGSVDYEFTETLRRDPMALVQYTSIRAINPNGSRPDKPWEITFPSTEVKSVVVEDAKRDKGAKRKAKLKKGAEKDPVAMEEAMTAAQKKKEKQGELVDVAPDDPRYAKIAEFLLGEFNGPPIPTNIKTSKAGDIYIINTECHYCQNKAGMHAHSSVFFIIRPKGCVQRCFSPKDIIYKNGKTCSQYVSTSHPLPKDLKELIFSDGVLRTRRHEEKKAKLAHQVFDHRPPSNGFATRPTVQAASALVKSFTEGNMEDGPSLDEMARMAEDEVNRQEAEQIEEQERIAMELGLGGGLAPTSLPPQPLAPTTKRSPPIAAAVAANVDDGTQQQVPTTMTVQEARRKPSDVMVIRYGARDYKYEERAARLKPRYTPFDFANAVKSANYKIV